ncbi:MAG: Na/Pi symporter [candidate division Zixibacteria bacterium]|nr:Na/Pi symporter [candidate division Zixibacteria bacterium]
MADESKFVAPISDRSKSSMELILKFLALLGLIYLFILSIVLLGGTFKLFGKGFADAIFHATSNPIVGLMIGIFTTAIIQSSSTTTCIVIGLVASGTLSFESSIPMVMGANIGTSVTNTMVAMGNISRRDEFQRAFSGSVLHDIFNLCSVAVLLPLQVSFNLIGRTAQAVEGVFSNFGGITFTSPLGVITKPVAKYIIHMTGDSAWISAVIAFVFLFIGLRYIAKLLKSMVLSHVEHFFQRYIFSTPVLSFVLGAVLTAVVQSSSITTSIIVPLIGAGILNVDQIYPYLLGANIGTTITALLAAFVTGSHSAISVAFSHLIFNIYGIGIFWPLKRIPIWLSTKLSKLTQKSKLTPILYVLIVFFIIPGVILFITD